MILVNPEATQIVQGSGLEGVYKQIELAARTCYKSEDKITESSAKPFVDKLIKRGHLSMLEHGTVYLNFDKTTEDNLAFSKHLYYQGDPYSRIYYSSDNLYVTTNLRVIVENGLEEDLEYICGPTKYHHKRRTIKFILDRATAQEFTRHRKFSFAMESQRYVALNKDIVIVKPHWFKDDGKTNEELQKAMSFFSACNQAYTSYISLRDKGLDPQDARGVLPNATKTELVMTGFEKDWEYFFKLRVDGTTGAPHPDAKILASLAKEQLQIKSTV